MRLLSGSIRGPWLVGLLVVSMALPETTAEAGKGRKGGGRGGRAPRVAAPRRPSTASRSNAYRAPQANNNAMATANRHVTNSNARTNTTATAGNGVRTTGSLASSPNAYSYGSGSNTRRYTANGYGHGYRNRSSGSHYGRSQGNNRSLVSRLRSVHSNLARLDHDYRGHRVNAMRSISNAIRMLSHRASGLRTNGNGNGNGNGALAANRLVANNRNAAGARNGNRANGAGQGQRMTQAQSDARMSQALRTTQGIHMQMANNTSSRSSRSSSSNGHQAARTHTARAIREMQTALATR